MRYVVLIVVMLAVVLGGGWWLFHEVDERIIWPIPRPVPVRGTRAAYAFTIGAGADCAFTPDQTTTPYSIWPSCHGWCYYPPQTPCPE